MTALWLPELPHTPFAILTVVFQKPADWSDKEPAEGIKSLGSEIPEKNRITYQFIRKLLIALITAEPLKMLTEGFVMTPDSLLNRTQE